MKKICVVGIGEEVDKVHNLIESRQVDKMIK